ncbi:unnamed protein product [Rotaria sordida]|uniref:Thioredoxin domain-containing protein n=1 Tax=Rotaria sordida TaxID=392033 RepID=A0A814VEQ4_9BILA|nr:unnamed protein product [Rotaria sordida]
MAQSRRFIIGNNLATIDSYDSVLEKSNKEPEKLIVVLFNDEFPDAETIEQRLKNWKNFYTTTYGTQFYKCIIYKGEQKIKTDFNIKDTPTFIFFRDGKEICRIDDLEETDLNIPLITASGEESSDEKRIKQKLDELCKNP